MTSAELIAIEEKYGAHNYHPLDVVIERAHGEAGGARRFCVALKERGILAKDTHSHIIRLAPLLVVTRADIDWAVGVTREVFQSI